MKRVVIPVLALLMLALGLGARWILERPAGGHPHEGDLPPFMVQPVGAGQYIQYQPSDIPIRSLIWSHPLPGRAAVAQLLTQSSRQQAMLFVDGRLATTVTLECPPDVPDNLFNFAELEDAALIPGRLLLLLYRPSPSGENPLLIAWNLQKDRFQWIYRGPGSHVVLSPDSRAAFLFGPDTPIQILQVLGRDGNPTPAPSPQKVDLPFGVNGFTDLLPTGPSDFLATSGSGLSAWKNGAWTRTPAPPPSPLGYPITGGTLAQAGKTLWWQPQPGQLIQVNEDASLVATQNLTGLLAGPHAQDAALLRLLGSDPEGRLWFTPQVPDFTAPAPPPEAPPVVLPAPAPVPGTPAPQPAVQAPPPPAASVPAPTGPAPIPPTREAWEPYLKGGLDRLYRWEPGSPAMAGFGWSAAWKQLAAPPAMLPPTGDGGLVPAADGFLLGDQTHRWWLPLGAIPVDQPR